jgi:hypothetical protein
MFFGLCNVQVFDMIDGKLVSPFVRLNPNLSSHFSGSGGVEDYTVDFDAESREMGDFEAAPPSVEEAFRHSMVPTVMGTRTMPVPRESSRIAGVSMDPLHMECPVEVPISSYFLVLEIQNFLLHEKFGVVGFSKKRPKFNIQLRPGILHFMEFCTANFEVVFWSTEVDERMEAQYDRLMRACPSLAQNPNRPKFARHWCDMSTSINPRTRKADITLKRLSRLFDDTRALGSTHANKDNTLLIDPFPRTCILNDPYNGFHPNLFAWNSENGETGLLYLLRVVQPFLQRMKDSGRPVHQFCALNNRVGWDRYHPGEPMQRVLSDVVPMDRRKWEKPGRLRLGF